MTSVGLRFFVVSERRSGYGNHYRDKLSAKLLYKRKRCHMVFLFKCPVKIGQVVKSYGQRDIQNREISLLEQLHSFFQPQIIDVFHTGHAHMFFKKAHKMIITEVTELGQF